MKTYFLKDIKEINFQIKFWDIIFLYWDLASGKTTLTKHIVNNLLWIKEKIISPTYTYYNKYKIINNKKLIINNSNVYHFDLYRLSNYDEFFVIWWEEILQNPNNICIIEWPEIIKPYFKPTIEIYLKKTQNNLEREIKFLK